MTCFWTDLVGAAQTGCGVGLRLAVGSTALEVPTPSTLAAMVSSFETAFTGTTPSIGESPYSIYTMLLDATGGDTEFQAEWSDAVYSNVAFFDHTATGSNTAGFVTQEGRYITTYAEFLVPGSLTVSGCWYVDYDSCGSPFAGATITAVSTTGASASVDANGFIETTPPTTWGAPTGGIVDFVMRVTGTITGENGTSTIADFYLFSHYNGCV